jgi:hypothetical protein
MRTNDRIRRRLETRIEPDTRIEAVVALQKANGGPGSGSSRSLLRRYMQRLGLTNSLGPLRLLDGQWLVLTENRVLLFSRSSSGFRSRVGRLDHAIDRTEVALQWTDFTTPTRTDMRLLHLTTDDQRMNVSQTVLGSDLRPGFYFDEADLLVQAFGDRASKIHQKVMREL